MFYLFHIGHKLLCPILYNSTARSQLIHSIFKQILRVVLIGDSLSKLTNEVKQSPQINEWGNVCRHLKSETEVISEMTLSLRILLIGNQIFF